MLIFRGAQFLLGHKPGSRLNLFAKNAMEDLAVFVASSIFHEPLIRHSFLIGHSVRLKISGHFEVIIHSPEARVIASIVVSAVRGIPLEKLLIRNAQGIGKLREGANSATDLVDYIVSLITHTLHAKIFSLAHLLHSPFVHFNHTGAIFGSHNLITELKFLKLEAVRSTSVG